MKEMLHIMLKRKLLILILFLSGLTTAFGQTGTNQASAQTKQATGVIVDEAGEAVVGASIMVKENPSIGTVSDAEGKFSLSNIPATAQSIVIRYIGYEDQELKIAKDLKVLLKPSTSELDEVLVVAYGTTKKAAFTGSATQVSGEKLSVKNQSEISKALAGEVAGVQVINTSGQPGTNATVRIRGYGSANSSRAPLYVVDGMPYEGDVSAIPASDVESTTVLKDASAAALYGARASNGVILITTKKGNKGKAIIEVDAKTGFNTRIIPLYDVLESPERYTELTWESIRNYGKLSGLSPVEAGVYASGRLFNVTNGISPYYNMWNTQAQAVVDPVTGKISAPRKYTPEKWADHMFNDGKRSEASIRFQGNSGSALSYFTSFGVLDEKGYYIGSDYSRLTGRTNLNYEPKKWLKATTNLAYTYQELNNPSQSDNMNNGFQFVNFMPPIYPVYQRDLDGKMITDPIVGGNRYDFGMIAGYERGYASGINPVMTSALDVNRSISHQLIGNANFEIKFLDDFKFTTSNGIQFLTVGQIGLENPYYGDAAGMGRIERATTTYSSQNLTQMLSYQKKINLHSVNVFIAHESYNNAYHVDYAQNKKLAKPDNLDLSNAISMNQIYGYSLGNSLESYFAQFKYDYNEKYFVDGNIRRDGSSRFTKNKWGTFWSAGAAWVINKEDFMQDLDDVNHLRYKISYGTYGNEALNIGTFESFYPTQNLYSINNLNDEISYSLGYIGNPDLTWERSSMLNTGIDFGVWDDRFEGEIEYYKKRTTDMIFAKQMPTSLGYASLTVNDAELDNSGIEFTLKGKVVKTEDWEVSLSANGSHYTNTMIKMPIGEGGVPKTIEDHGTFFWSKGRSIYDFYMREYAGVDPATGVAQWKVYYDKSNPVLDADGSPTKDYTRVGNMTQYLADRKADGKEVDLIEENTNKYA
ncbi:MAG: SusC/RagA family TonB-linked outer membrane protein, partial [Tannerella sp.]|nr:SusC/RagA family TonB-linked outer membrane protein [Tannerella sp.]